MALWMYVLGMNNNDILNYNELLPPITIAKGYSINSFIIKKQLYAYTLLLFQS